MEDQPKSSSFIKAFLPGLAIGLVVGALGGAFIAPMINTDPPPLKPSRGVSDIPPGMIPAPPPDAIDERAPMKTPGTEDAKKDETKPAEPAPVPAPAPK